MEPATWIALGMFVVAAVATVSSLMKTKRRYDKDARENNAELIKARTEMNLGSIEAAERVIAIHGVALAQAQERIKELEEEIKEMRKNGE